MLQICPFCQEFPMDSLENRIQEYRMCPGCGGISLDRTCWLSPELERKRYEKHTNSLEDQGYRTYVESFLAAVFGYLNPELVHRYGKSVESFGISILDYGSGPYPALVEILRERGFDVRGYDPFFSPQTDPFPDGADVVTCLEVAEHFQNPCADFKKIAAWLHAGSVLAVQTQLLPDTKDRAVLSSFFSGWWYRHDRTHVSFYTPEALRRTAQSAGFSVLSAVRPNTVLFRYEG
jgi:pseudouridine kinase